MTLSLPAESATRLAQEFGISASTLVESILDGDIARSVITPLHPRGFKGISGWAAIVAGLRGRLIPFGWSAVDTAQNLATVVSPEGSIAIAVASGDSNTGNPFASPRTRNEKGEATRAAVEENERQGKLFGELPVVLKKNIHPVPIGRTYWLLVYHAKDLIHFELSLPMAIDEDGRLADWHDRILFDPISRETAVMSDAMEQMQEKVVVDVTRKK